MYSWAWDWNGGWGFPMAFGVIFGLAIYVVPWLFFLLNLRGLLERVSVYNRGMSPEYVWLNFIPIFNLGWFIYTVTKVRDSVRNEYQSRGWPADGDFGYNVGLVAGVLVICSVVLGWVPVLGLGLAVAALVCWIIYWLKTNDLRNRLGVAGVWPAGGGPAPYPGRGRPRAGRPWAGAIRSGAVHRYAAISLEPTAGRGARVAVAGCGFDRSGQALRRLRRHHPPGDRFCQSCGLPLPQSMQTAAGTSEMPPSNTSPPDGSTTTDGRC